MMKFKAILLIFALGSISLSALAAKSASQIEDEGGDCHFNYESGRYYGSECPTSSAHYPRHRLTPAQIVEANGGDCHFNYESGRYYGSECPRSTGIRIPLRADPNAPSDFRN